MKIPDFSRSFLTFRIDVRNKPPVTASHEPPYSLNNARIAIECRCVVHDRTSGRSEAYFLGASCKTERVGVDRDVWTEPNADFVPIFSSDEFMHLKTYAKCGIDVPAYGADRRQPDRQRGRIEDAFDEVRIDLVERDGTALESAKEIVEATLANRPMVARTRIESEDFLVTLDYPVKTMNANERDWIYQTDSGPVLFPDLTRKPSEMMAGMELAFAAFNGPEWTEFIIRSPTPVADDVNAQHYSRAERVDCRNQVFVE